MATGVSLGLAHTRDAAVLEDLLAFTALEQRPRVRAGAAMALGVLGDTVDSTRDRCVERLIEMLAEPGVRTQLSAMGALATIRDARAIPALERVHRTAGDGRSRRVAYEALYKIRAGRTTEAGLAAMRGRLEALAEENSKLRGRIDKLERVDDA